MLLTKKQIEYKTKGDENKSVPIEECLKQIRPYVSDNIDNLRTSATWKIH